MPNIPAFKPVVISLHSIKKIILQSARVYFCFLVLVLSGCGGQPQVVPTQAEPTPPALAATSQTPFQPAPVTPTATATPVPPSTIWVAPGLPVGLVSQMTVPEGISVAEDVESASFWLEPADQPVHDNSEEIAASQWVYVLAAPFPTIPDGLTSAELIEAWQGRLAEGPLTGWPIFLSAETEALFEQLWGKPADGAVEIMAPEDLIDAAWSQRRALALLPFEKLEARWKVLRVDDQSPLDKEFDPLIWPLTISFRLSGSTEEIARISQGSDHSSLPRLLSAGNRDAQKLTVVAVTGVTALVRATAWQMNRNGIEFPARDVGDLLRDADLTHLSNEVAFAPSCPPADPNSGSLRFCSNPDHFGLLQYVGADVVELSGNHVNDWGWENLAYSLELYKNAGIQYYSGGANTAESRQPALFEHNGNKIAFIGCNPAGPIYAWATDTQAGSADCSGDWLPAEITLLKNEGYLVIATLQFDESYDPAPLPRQIEYFTALSEAGATIVSGSQAHYPQGFGFHNNQFIHYGLGNLFFDQMYYNGLGPGTRWEFIDQHVFYEGRHIGTQVVTAMLEEYARPRLMTPEERAALLELIYKASGWPLPKEEGQ